MLLQESPSGDTASWMLMASVPLVSTSWTKGVYVEMGTTCSLLNKLEWKFNLKEISVFILVFVGKPS